MIFHYKSFNLKIILAQQRELTELRTINRAKIKMADSRGKIFYKNLILSLQSPNAGMSQSLKIWGGEQ